MPRDTIAIAFHQSAYATPATDHTIPGNHPGHRDRRLGRQYAPNPTSRSSLTCALYVPGTELGNGGVCSTDMNNHLNHTLLVRDGHNAGYVLQTPYGGRRHFPEERGQEVMWQRGIRYVPPPMPDALLRAPIRKALGVYNDKAAYQMPEVQWAQAERELRTARGRAGKGIVYRRPDHAPLELGLCCMFGGRMPDQAKAADAPDAPAALESSPKPGETLPTVTAESLPNVTAESLPNGAGQVTLPVIAHSTASGPRGVGEVYYGTRRAEQRMPSIPLSSAHAARRRKEALKRARMEDIRLVRLLPK